MFGSTIKVVSFVSTNDEHIVNQLKRQAAQVTEFITERQIYCTAEVILYEGVSRLQKIAEYLNQNRGMALITTHQHPDIVDFFIGSFAADLIHIAKTPVMSIIPIGVIKYTADMPGIR
jgi:nucleotide-binding universal stress UspA family protein